MSPTIALLVWFVLLLALLYFDPAKSTGASIAVWVPLIWMIIVGSRLPSQWLGGQTGTVEQALEDGNSLDRIVFSVLILLAIGILLTRSFRWADFLVKNLALMALISFTLMSVFWSDFPFVAFKRWFRDLGNYLVILVAMTETVPLEGVRTLLRRLFYTLISLSVLLVRYNSDIGRSYSIYTGVAEYVGVATSKNTLGVLCMLSGIFFFWDTLTRWPDRKVGKNKKAIFVNVIFFVMTMWLLNLSNSATSRACLVMGCMILLLANSGWGKNHAGFVKVLLPSTFVLYLILAFGFNLNGDLASQLGRDPTLTDRTLIWNAVLSVHTNPVIGTGYQSFWLGPRLQQVWSAMPGVNEAHNGYIAVYLDLGMIGVALVVGFLLASYIKICKGMRTSSALSRFGLAVWTVLLFYNMAEAAFNVGLLWMALLMGSMTVPGFAKEPEHSVAPVDDRVPLVAPSYVPRVRSAPLKPGLETMRERR